MFRETVSTPDKAGAKVANLSMLDTNNIREVEREEQTVLTGQK